MTEPVIISQYPRGFLGVLVRPVVFVPLIIVVAVVFIVIVGRLINVMTHGKRRPLLCMSIAFPFAILCTFGVLSVDPVTPSNNFDIVSNAYGITISEDHDIMRVLQPGARVDSTSITFTDGDGKPQMGVLVRKGGKVTVYSNAANRLTPLKRAAH